MQPFDQFPQSEPVDVAAWNVDPDFAVHPVGSKPKRMVQCPDPAPQPFLIPGHAYLFKVAHAWRAQQLWSEFIAYRIGALAGLDVPPCYLAINSKTGEVGALIEFFFGYPGQDTKRLVHGIDIMRRLKLGSDTGRTHGVRANVLIARAFKVGAEVEWWGRTLTFDALIGNTDRHTENWGFLFDRKPGEKLVVTMAPAFDNGTSLAYEITDQALQGAAAAERLKEYIAKGRHHCGWELDEIKGAPHIDLCARYLSSFPEAGAAMKNVIRFEEAQISAILESCTKFNVTVPFSPPRADMVLKLILERRRQLSVAFGD
ncbi:HipA domain-containing protein [Bradyrhizobium sp. 521_C7_N1_3]|uniref:HipA domain-containing protein n=1 Tax=Bradyrhizobium sp. 521_C7_N1_3 TaxID=3240368 RepID=UPI003F8C50BD